MSELLPIGTVVTLNTVKEDISLMIIGYYPQQHGITYDYTAVIYPDGLLSDQNIFMFHTANIKEVLYEGLIDDNCKELLAILPEIMEVQGH